MREHVIQVLQLLLPRGFLVLDFFVHILALGVNVGHDLLLVGNPGPLLLDDAVCDSLQLGSDRVQVVVMVLYSVLLFLLDSFFEFVPVTVSGLFQRLLTFSRDCVSTFRGRSRLPPRFGT